mmetsp:Transcript_108525/g.187580  ORF Transcript_108525/g.187580 Transcript_108525/m.187580 type:complete len:231 (+) Transcript_108525:1251-1943(+)
MLCKIHACQMQPPRRKVMALLCRHVPFIDWADLSNALPRVYDQTRQCPVGVHGEGALGPNVQSGASKLLEQDFCSLLAVLHAVLGGLREEYILQARVHPKLGVCMCPNLLHALPVLNDPSGHWVSQGKHTALALCLLADERASCGLPHHSPHHSLAGCLGATHNGGEHTTGVTIACKACPAHPRATVDHHCRAPECGAVCELLQEADKPLRVHRGPRTVVCAICLRRCGL